MKTEGFILKKKTLLEKDFLISIFTEKKGKINCLAKGARKITSRRLSYLETGNLVDILIEEKRSIFYIKEINLKSCFLNIKNNLKKINLMYQFLYFLERILPENQKEENVFKLTKLFFIKMSINKNQNEVDSNNLLYFYMNKILIELGYLKFLTDKYKIEKTFLELTNEKITSFIV